MNTIIDTYIITILIVFKILMLLLFYLTKTEQKHERYLV